MKYAKRITILLIIATLMSPVSIAYAERAVPEEAPVQEERQADQAAYVESRIPQSKGSAATDAKTKGKGRPIGGEEAITTMGAAEQPPLPAISPSAIGGAFSSLMSESFQTDLATGAATLSIPIVVPPGRKNVQPNIALSYSSNNPNGVCGVGWSIPVASIQRSTKEGVPRYNTLDDFVAGGEELVKIREDDNECEFRAKIESSFTKYLYKKANKEWIAFDKSGTKYYFGLKDTFGNYSRIFHPDYPDYIFAWYVDKVVDVYGNAMTYSYEKDGGSVYLKYIEYTSNALFSLSADKKVEFVYETDRQDKIYNNRPGWPTVIKRRLDKINVYLDSNIVWTYNLSYILSTDTSRSLLKSTQLKDSAGVNLPAKTFTYQKLEP